MKMKSPTKYFLIFHTVMTILIGVGMWLVLKFFISELLVNGYLIIPLYFYLEGLIYIWCFNHSPILSADYVVNLYLFMRIIKLFTSTVIMVVYWFIHSQSIKSFALIFIIYYLFNLMWETHIYFKMEKYIKYNKES